MVNLPEYSVLMSVYYKEKAEYLQESIESVYIQTKPTDDFILVCDGPLNTDLDRVIQCAQEKFGERLHVIRLEENVGLGNALNIGIQHCKHELVARMDSDDICVPDRFEKQIKIFQEQPDVQIVSGTVLEFRNTINMITGKRMLPEFHEDICRFSRKRNPFNHPAIMVKKTMVEKAGGYMETFPLFEDYFLWVRMLQNGSVGYNLQEPILYMRTPEALYMRRGGWQYAKNMLRYHDWMRKSGWSDTSEYILGAIPHALVCVMPNFLRRVIYGKLHS